jgi:hypothetical protein
MEKKFPTKWSSYVCLKMIVTWFFQENSPFRRKLLNFGENSVDNTDPGSIETLQSVSFLGFM